MVDDRSLTPDYSAALKPTRVFHVAPTILEYSGILRALCQRLDQDLRWQIYGWYPNLDRIARGACIRLGRSIPQNNAEFSAEFWLHPKV